MNVFNSLVSILFLLTLISCGSSEKESGLNDPLDQFQGISNDDFNLDQAKDFSAEDDNFEEDDLDTLSRESISRSMPLRLEKIAKSSDPVGKAISLCYKKKYADGLKVLDEVYKKYKKSPSYWNQIGTCYYLQNEFRKALLYYNKSIEVNSKYAPPLNNLGVIYSKKGEDQKALKAFERASKLNPYSLTPIFNMAQLYLEYGLLDEAENYFMALYKKGKKDYDVIGGLANTYLFKSNIDEAVKFFEELPEEAWEGAHIGLNYAIALKIKDRKSRSRLVFESVNRENLSSWKAYYRKVGKFVGAL